MADPALRDIANPGMSATPAIEDAQRDRLHQAASLTVLPDFELHRQVTLTHNRTLSKR
jgi:hypothetical protein